MRFCGRCGDGAADTHNYCETCGCGLAPFKYMTFSKPGPSTARSGWGDSATVAAGRALLPEPKIRTQP